MEYAVAIISALGGLGFGAILTWFFGGRQAHSNSVDNDSHQREKDFYDLVDNRAEKEVTRQTKRIIKCASVCPHSGNCPVINEFKDE